MALQTSSPALTRNVRLAIFEAGVSLSSVASATGIKRRTFYRRLQDGRFTITELQAVAKATGTTLLDLLPDESKAAS